MSPELVPLLVELFSTLLFCVVLFSIRKSVTTRAVVFWVLLWAARGALSLYAVHLVATTERLVLALVTPLQIAFSLALVLIAVRLENQKQQLRALNEELTRLRKAAAAQMDLDPLTGLRSRSAMTQWLDETANFRGTVVVCDMDDFKQLNDSYGHLVGDEILQGVGKLIRNSIRDQDRAFRWGGDEFVVFFETEDTDLVTNRLQKLEEHLQGFHIRQHGTIVVRFSWGIAPTAGRSLRESMEEADRLMYECKRARRLQPPGKASAKAK